jgi:hypothetical protein
MKRGVRGDGTLFWSDYHKAWIGRAVVGVRPDGQPITKQVQGQTRALAFRRKKEVEEKARAGLIGEAAKITTGQYLDHWLKNVAKPTVQLSTWTSYERCVRLHLVPRIGGILLCQLKKVHVEAMFAELQRDGVSGGNAKKVSEVLSTALQHALGNDDIPLQRNPAALAAKPVAPEEEIVPFTPTRSCASGWP